MRYAFIIADADFGYLPEKLTLEMELAPGIHVYRFETTDPENAANIGRGIAFINAWTASGTISNLIKLED
mgnify:CR=1